MASPDAERGMPDSADYPTELIFHDGKKGKTIEKIAPVVVPTGTTSPSHEVVVFGLDDDGGLWKWDTGIKTDELVQVCKPTKG